MDSSSTVKPLRVLVADQEFAAALPDLAARHLNLQLVGVDETHDLCSLAVGAFDVLVTQSAKVDASLLNTLQGLQLVLKLGRNYSNVDVEAVRARNVRFVATPRKGPNCVAELALTFVLALSKDLLIAHESVETGAYRLRGLRPTMSSQTKIAFQWMQNTRIREIRGKTLGIIGMGEIGCELARRSHAMGMRNLYYKRTPLSAELETTFGAEYRDLNALLRESDFVCLTVPQTSDTEKMIGRNELALMRPDAYFINICRGGVVDEEALIEALENNQIAGAGLDVFVLEPLEADSPLCDLDNVILTPHIGGGTGSNRGLELGEGLDQIAKALSG